MKHLFVLSALTFLIGCDTASLSNKESNSGKTKQIPLNDEEAPVMCEASDDRYSTLSPSLNFTQKTKQECDISRMDKGSDNEVSRALVFYRESKTKMERISIRLWPKKLKKLGLILPDNDQIKEAANKPPNLQEKVISLTEGPSSVIDIVLTVTGDECFKPLGFQCPNHPPFKPKTLLQPLTWLANSGTITLVIKNEPTKKGATVSIKAKDLNFSDPYPQGFSNVKPQLSSLQFSSLTWQTNSCSCQ